MIHIEKLEKRYGKVAVLKGIDLHIPAGEIFAYLGPNGAGKSTTIRILTGLTKLTMGRVSLGGHDIKNDSISARGQCGVVHQQINLDQELTLFENLDIHGRLFGMKRTARRRKIKELLAYVELDDRTHSLVNQLSGGMKRRVMIARALVHSPRILFLDEPTVGLDANFRRRIWGLIKKIQQDGVTIFLTTHYIEEAEFLADRVAFLDIGRIIAVDTPVALMDKLGEWAIDQLTEKGMQTNYFQTREEAREYCGDRESGFTLRRVNLEDAFLSLTGKKVQ